jgi:cytochrome c oxidase cbb3-type subunit III
MARRQVSIMRRLLFASLAAVVVAVSCEREARRYRDQPASAVPPDGVRLTTLRPGGPTDPAVAREAPFSDNAQAMADGKRLYSAFNCNGCHALGGGGIGPPLMDDQWIYGAAADQIYSTIVQGRPDGMPSFGGKIPDQQVWQLVAYVQSLSGLPPLDVKPGRNDDLAARPPEARTPPVSPKQTGHR